MTWLTEQLNNNNKCLKSSNTKKIVLLPIYFLEHNGKKTQNNALEKAGKYLTTLNNAKESLKKEKKAFDVIRKN